MQGFVSAVFSGAAGVYMGLLDHDAGISTLLTVRPGQSVSVTGDPSFAPAPDGPISNGRPTHTNMRDAPLWGPLFCLTMWRMTRTRQTT